MKTRVKGFIRKETAKIAQGLCITLCLLIGIACLRAYSTGTFLFIQIISACLVLLLILYVLGHSSVRVSWIRGSEIYLTVFAFTISSFLLLNVDRSRSIYLLKWIDNNRSTGLTFRELATIAERESFGENALIQRLREQIESGNVYLDPQTRYRSTFRGHTLNVFFSTLADFEHLEGYKGS